MLNRYLNSIIFVFGLLLSELAFGQQVPITNQYLVNPYSLSPAFAGYNQMPELFVGYRKQWTAMPGSPKTSSINFCAPLNQRVWLGGNIISDETDILQNIYASLSYTYNLPVFTNSYLSFSLWGSAFQNTLNLSKINVAHNQDPLLMDKDKLVNVVFNAGTGINFRRNNFIIGIVVPNLFVNRNTYQGEEINNILEIERQYIAYTSYQISISSNWQLKPFLLFRSTKNTDLNYDISTLIKYYNKYWLGLTYRKGSIIGLSAGGELISKLILNYTYEFSNNGFTGYTSGTHEFTIGYNLNMGIKNIKKSIGKYPMIMKYDPKKFKN